MQTNVVFQAITTKYLGPTDRRGARVKATACSGISKTVGYDHSASTEDAHRQAAEALRVKLEWEGQLVQGSLPNGYAFVLVK